MKTSDFLHMHRACRNGAKWALAISDDMADVWDALVNQGKHKWLLWTATRPNVFPDSTLRRLACRFVRETPLVGGGTVWDRLTDERSRHAVEVAEAYAAGNATTDELAAAYASADAAADAAYFAASAAASYVADAANAAANVAAYARAAGAARAARAAAYSVDDSAAIAAYAAAYAADKSAQVRMLAELGNPFRKEGRKRTMTQEIKHDPVNHPKHYAALPAAVECIDIARHLPYPLGCAVKYVWRAGNKDKSLSGQDLDKALWYIEDYEAMLNDADAPDFPVAKAIWDLVTAPVDRRTMIVGYIVAGHFGAAVDCIQTLKEILANGNR